MKNNKHVAEISGYIAFFLLVAAIITVAITVFVTINNKTNGNPTLISIIMICCIAVLSLIMTVCDYIRRRIMVKKPVSKILDATEHLAEGDFSFRLNTNHTYYDSNDYNLIMENLNIVAQTLGKSETLKLDFISNVSHEIKTPIAIIQNYVTLLQSSKLTEDEKNDCVKTVLNATNRLNDLVNNILKLNKLENQTLRLELETVNLENIVEESIISFEEIIQDKELNLEVTLKDATIRTSKTLITLIVNNLLSNAIKFTNNGGTVAIVMERTSSGARISVKDTGCGISKEDGARIFDKFFQCDRSHSKNGNGLGLALVKKVIDLLGGSITVESELGTGSTFTVELKDEI